MAETGYYCIESDGGNVSTTAGFARLGTDAEGEIEKQVDECSGDTLTEYYCVNNNAIRSQSYTCDHGCSDGECRTSSYAPPVSAASVTRRQERTARRISLRFPASDEPEEELEEGEEAERPLSEKRYYSPTASLRSRMYRRGQTGIRRTLTGIGLPEHSAAVVTPSMPKKCERMTLKRRRRIRACDPL